MLLKSHTIDDTSQPGNGANNLLAMACTELTKRFAYMSMKCGGLTDEDQQILLLMWEDAGFQRGYDSLRKLRASPNTLAPQEL